MTDKLRKISKPIKGYEELYTINPLGEIYSIRRKKILIGGIDGCGYRGVMLFKNYKYKRVRIGRLVAVYFIPNPNNLRWVNHIDGNKLNDEVDNLEWCTPSENQKHAYKIGLKRSDYLRPGRRKKILQITGDQTIVHNGVFEAHKKTGIDFANISKCLHGERKMAGGFIWKIA